MVNEKFDENGNPIIDEKPPDNQASPDNEQKKEKLDLNKKQITCPHCLTLFDLMSSDIIKEGKKIFDDSLLPDNKPDSNQFTLGNWWTDDNK